jgi:hypothetical protein
VNLRFSTGYVDEDVLSIIAGCSASAGTAQNDCIDFSEGKDDVSLEECPSQCKALSGKAQSAFQVQLSEKKSAGIRFLECSSNKLCWCRYNDPTERDINHSNWPKFVV